MSSQVATAAAAGGVAPAIPPVHGNNNNGQPAAAGFSISGVLQGLFRMYLFYMLFQYLFKGSTPTPTTTNSNSPATTSIPLKQVNPSLGPHRNIWPPSVLFDIYVYMNSEPDWNCDLIYSTNNQTQINNAIKSQLVWHEKGLTYDYADHSNRNKTITLSEDNLLLLQANISLYSHLYFVQAGYPHCKNQPPPNQHKKYHRNSVISYSHQLNLYKPAPKIDKRKNLITGEAKDKNNIMEVNETVIDSTEPEASEEFEEELILNDLDDENDNKPTVQQLIKKNRALNPSRDRDPNNRWVNYMKPNLNLRLVYDFSVFSAGSVPAQIAEFMQFDDHTNNYYPIVYIDDFWLISNQLIPINNTVTSLNLSLSYSPISMFRWQIQHTMDQSWKMQQSMYGQSESETESIKKILAESNPYFLAITIFVSILHSVFDFLAFKNDIQFWKSNKSLAGLSARAIATKCVCMTIIFLYLFDNDTSWLILISNGIGLIIEYWKLQKAVYIKKHNQFPYFILVNKNTIIEEGKEATEEQKALIQTQDYDREAMKYLSYVLYPLVGCYAIYSLYYESHKSWYSYIISVLVGSVYTFGFIEMCPQLYINYKLKSVAHLPWRMLTYKALNTFVDDLFAFVITMPTMHRLACFRDDIIFFIFLYQKWIYRVDTARVNEFGISGDDIKEFEARSTTGTGNNGVLTNLINNLNPTNKNEQKQIEPPKSNNTTSANNKDSNHSNAIEESESNIDSTTLRKRAVNNNINADTSN